MAAEEIDILKNVSIDGSDSNQHGHVLCGTEIALNFEYIIIVSGARLRRTAGFLRGKHCYFMQSVHTYFIIIHRGLEMKIMSIYTVTKAARLLLENRDVHKYGTAAIVGPEPSCEFSVSVSCCLPFHFNFGSPAVSCQ